MAFKPQLLHFKTKASYLAERTRQENAGTLSTFERYLSFVDEGPVVYTWGNEYNSIEDVLTSTSTGAALSANMGRVLNEKIEALSNSGATITEITYLDLYMLCQEGNLIPGMYYRITDYVTTSSQTNTTSANHPFDLIVLAIDEYTLSEDAHAVQHEGDTYFSECNLAAWDIKYSIENDRNRFGWAKTFRPYDMWTCSLGVLGYNKTGAEVLEPNHTVEIDGQTKYLYRPIKATSHLSNYNIYKEVGSISITDPESLIFICDYEPYYEDDGDGVWVNWEGISEMRVYTSDMQYVTRLNHLYDGMFIEEDGDEMYSISFNGYPEQLDDGTYRYTPYLDSLESWFETIKNGEIRVSQTEDFGGDVNSLYYAFTSKLFANQTYYVKSLFSLENNCSCVAISNNAPITIDTVSYLTAVHGGKGVIYYMKDEFDNECSYDFKNILTKHPNDTTKYPNYYYTFSTSDSQDLTVGNKNCVNNKLMPVWGELSQNTGQPYPQFALGRNVFIGSKGSKIYSNYIGFGSYHNSFGDNSYGNTLGNKCYNNSFGDSINNNNFEDNCYNNTFGSYCNYNNFREGCKFISCRMSNSKTASLRNYVMWNDFGRATSYVILYNSATASSTQSIKNVRLSEGISGTTSSYVGINVETLGANYNWEIAKNSSGTVKQFCLADLIA